MTGRSVGTVLRLLMAAAVVAAIVTQLVNQLDVGASLVNFFSFFTIQSNIIGVVAVTSAALAGPAARRQPVAQSAPRGRDPVHGRHRDDLQPAAQWCRRADADSLGQLRAALHLSAVHRGGLAPRPFGASADPPAGPDLSGLPDRLPGVHADPRPDRRLVPVPVPRPTDQRVRLRRDHEPVRRRGRPAAGLAAVLDLAPGLRSAPGRRADRRSGARGCLDDDPTGRPGRSAGAGTGRARRRARHPAGGTWARSELGAVVGPVARGQPGGDHRRARRVLPGGCPGRDHLVVSGVVPGLRAAGSGPRGGRGPVAQIRAAGSGRRRTQPPGPGSAGSRRRSVPTARHWPTARSTAATTA